MMVVTSPKLSALVLVAIPVIVLPLVGVRPRGARSARARAQDTLAEATAFAAESLGAVRTMQAFGAETRDGRRASRPRSSAYRRARATHAGARAS